MKDGAVITTLPEAFLKKMKGLLGTEYDAFLESYETERAYGLRQNPLKMTDAEETGLKSVSWCKEGYYYDPADRPGRHPYHEAGVYYIQEPSAMAVVELLDPKPGDLVLDLCGAPGGKSTHAAGRLGGEGMLVCNEIHPARARILSQNIERMGVTNAVVTNEDAGRLTGYFPEFFDKIIVDAPCSGEGMFRKDELARTEWSEDHVMLCAARQQEILDHAEKMLKPGGRMVYSTCTFSPEEDESAVARFVERHPEMSIEPVTGRAGLSAGRPEWSSIPCKDLEQTFRIWPHLAEGEGHYLAVLNKEEDKDTKKRVPRQKFPKYWQDRDGIRSYRGFAEQTLQFPVETGHLLLFGDQLYQAPVSMPDISGLRVLRPGLHLGTVKKNRFEPSHALALSLRPEQVRQSCSYPADSDQIRGFLGGSTLPADSAQRGWVLVCVDGYSLGWAKAASGILKNHYPKGLRIPMG